jgi:hypothetical protein
MPSQVPELVTLSQVITSGIYGSITIVSFVSLILLSKKRRHPFYDITAAMVFLIGLHSAGINNGSFVTLASFFHYFCHRSILESKYFSETGEGLVVYCNFSWASNDTVDDSHTL